MRIVLLAVGRSRGPLAPAILDYETRAARYWPLEVREVKEESARALSPAEVRRQEGARLLGSVPDGASLIVCDERGQYLDSAAFATLLRQQRELAQDLAFAIGGAYGLDEQVRARADRVLAIAPWTLPHDLARLVLAEQLYRSGTIARGEPYHK